MPCIPSPWGQAGFGWSGTPAIWNKMRKKCYQPPIKIDSFKSQRNSKKKLELLEIVLKNCSLQKTLWSALLQQDTKKGNLATMLAGHSLSTSLSVFKITPKKHPNIQKSHSICLKYNAGCRWMLLQHLWPGYCLGSVGTSPLQDLVPLKHYQTWTYHLLSRKLNPRGGKRKPARSARAVCARLFTHWAFHHMSIAAMALLAAAAGKKYRI